MAMTPAERAKKWRENNPSKFNASQKAQQEKKKAERKKKGPRQFSGNHPDEAMGWEHIADTEKMDNRVWSVYAKESGNGSEWWQVKVCCNGKRARKANFWLSWNGERMAKGKAYAQALEDIPQMPEAVKEILKDQLSFQANG